jgi:glycosyltransferase involved in cell wall biosynthesis
MDSKMPADITFSFVVPAFNEQEGLEHFYGRLKVVADQLGEPYEILFVNDGSTDDTATVIRHLREMDGHVKCVEFSRNFGHQVAITAGYDFAQGKAVISLDSDCQHPPEMIPELVARWREGFEVVCTIRKDTEGLSRFRRWIGHVIYRVIRLATGADLTDQADFRLLDRKVVQALRNHREHARFVRGLVHWVGFRRAAVPYKAERRAAGSPGYTLRQSVNMSTAGVFNYSLMPLRLAGVVGAALLGISATYAILALLLWPFGLAPAAAVSVALLFVAMFGVQFLLMGILGEYVGRIFEEAKARPLYILRETFGFDTEDQAAKQAQGASDKAGKKPKDQWVVYT